MVKGLCFSCHRKPISGRNRKYCQDDSRQASAIWKREHRRLWKAAGDKYWLSDWKNKTSEERRAYFRTYMQEYRRKKHLKPAKTAPAEGGNLQ